MTRLDDSRLAQGPGRGATLAIALALLWLIVLVAEKLAGQPGLSLFALIAFVIAHGIATMGARSIVVFFAVTMLVSFLLEALSIATGFPFGFYVHHMAMPRPLGVPLIVPPSYAVYGYLGWRLACTILRCEEPGPSAQRLLGAPLLAAFIIPGLDLVGDAMGSTVAGTWSYLHPSGYFGVPLTNFLGWIFTCWAMVQLYALVEALTDRKVRHPIAPTRLRVLPPLVWILLALQFVPDLLRGNPAIASVAGRSFLVSDILESGVIVGLLAMGPPALAALFAVLGSLGTPARR
ncbi:carotenoid biosynthesis protein [Novosphingobium olei]|uniref:Carotenoid biosynthesis protein n=1 Tax=Novosphingobium olei TaxID=2728851 RepID=A0A7Y0GAJ7_9SPHN|nr:carotenoid biosynthesis protein [Novosphingobium olei]NML94163.1 carotenoid biosynthesis protein [Novosphingobium olei]